MQFYYLTYQRPGSKDLGQLSFQNDAKIVTHVFKINLSCNILFVHIVLLITKTQK